MRCPKCNYDHAEVIDSRQRFAGRTVNRRRQCKRRGCKHRWSTEEISTEVFEQLLGMLGSYVQLESAIKTTSADGRALLDQLLVASGERQMPLI